MEALQSTRRVSVNDTLKVKRETKVLAKIPSTTLRIYAAQAR